MYGYDYVGGRNKGDTNLLYRWNIGVQLIAIFSKFAMAGGSERRCVELANGIARYFSGQGSMILAERNFPESLRESLWDCIPIVTDALSKPEKFYEADCVIVVNTDSREFSTLDYWRGKTVCHDKEIDLTKVKKMVFLYNFLVSPSRHLHEIAGLTDVSIITTNNKFFNEITRQDRYERIRNLPRYVLGSPINPDSVKTRVREGYGFVFGCHSKSLSSKWNTDWPKLVDKITSRYPESSFRFMGTKRDIPNSVCFREDEETISDFLDSLDVFVFFPDYKREEPWARVIAEAMMAGLPVIALDKGGTSDQILKWNNGILCKKFDDYHKALIYLLEHPNEMEVMSRNAIRIAEEFKTENIIKKLMRILNGNYTTCLQAGVSKISAC